MIDCNGSLRTNIRVFLLFRLCINVHASLLPSIEGITNSATLIDGRKRINYIYMDEGMDTGDIILQREWIYARMAQVASRRLSTLSTMLEVLKMFEQV